MEETAHTQNLRTQLTVSFAFFTRFFPVYCLPPAQACAIISSQFCVQRYAAPWPPRAISQIFRCFNTLQCVTIIDHPTRDWFETATLWPGLSANNGQINRKQETKNWIMLIRPLSLHAVRMLDYSSHRIPLWTTWRTLTDTKTKFLSVCMFCLGLHCGIVFQCSNTSSTKANDTNAESRLHVFLIFPLFSSISFWSQRPQNPIFRFVLRPFGVE